jgi:site-specific DNA-methyltransferase (cytosine-N4-specific)
MSSYIQINDFEPMLQAYAEREGAVSNELIYESMSLAQSLPAGTWDYKIPVGRSGSRHNIHRRQVRWHQQTMKKFGLLERAPGPRGHWQATEKLRELQKEKAAAREKDSLTRIPARMVLMGFSTDLGVALWGDAMDVFTRLDEPIHLCLTSLPYPLRKPRAYGGPTEAEYVDFTTKLMEPIVRHMVPGACIALNISNDVFESKLPSRSLYRERLVLALHDRLGLHKLDELIWHNPTKAPGPIQWASKNRFQLNVAWEPVYVFTNDPALVRADNRRVLQPHTEAQKKLIAKGGNKRTKTYGDGANRLLPGAFSNPTEGAIPRNVMQFPHRCPSQIQLRKELEAEGHAIHGATMPLALAEFLVKYLSEEGDLVVDCCGGWQTTALAAELNGRRWITTELFGEYVGGGALRFDGRPGYRSQLELSTAAVHA